MALEVMKSVQRTEAEAEELYKKALEESREAAKKADREIAAEIARMQAELAKDAEEKMALAEKEAKEEIERVMEVNENECRMLEEKASQNLERATSLVMERIVKSLDH